MIKKTQIMFIYPGPAMNFRYSHQAKFKKFSENFEGFIVTTSRVAENEKIGSFEFKSIVSNGVGNIITSLKLLAVCNKIIRNKKGTDQEISLIVTYDPLKTGLFGFILKKIYGIKLIVEVNGDFSAIENYTGSKFAFINRLKRYIYMKLEKFILFNSDGIKLLYNEQISWTGIDPAKHVIQKIFSYQALENFRNIKHTNQVLFLGHPYYLKGVDLLIKAFKRIATRYPDWELKIVGWFQEENELLDEIDGHPQIIYSKAIEPDLVCELIGSCGFLVLPSRTEAMGRVLLEAMASSKPRIGTRVGGIPTVIDDGKDGLLVEPEDVGALADALDKLLDDPDYLKQLGRNARKRFEEEFTVEHYAESWKELVSNVLLEKT